VRTLSLLLVLLPLAACDGLRQTKHCDLREVEAECQEYGVFGPDILTLQGVCASVGGTWGNAECPREGILGGCEDHDPSNPWQVTRWLYEGYEDDLTTAEEAQDECDDEVETFVPAP